MLIEMGNQHKQDWYLHLPWVLLLRRVALQPDLGTSSSKIVLGMDPVVPGQLVGAPGPPMPPDHVQGLVKHLEAAADTPAKQTSNHNKSNQKEYMPASTETATHAYIKVDNPKGLLQSYTGPHLIVERPSQSTIKVKVGTFKSGIDNIQLHHWSNAKPASMRADAKEAQMKPRGRPAKVPPPVDTPSLDDGRKSTEPNRPESPTIESKPVSEPAKSTKKSKQPTRRSERLKQKTHETSSLECRSAGAQPASAGNSNSKIDRSHIYWSASQIELDVLNQQIHGIVTRSV